MLEVVEGTQKAEQRKVCHGRELEERSEGCKPKGPPDAPMMEERQVFHIQEVLLE